jgi:hypothetical protein
MALSNGCWAAVRRAAGTSSFFSMAARIRACVPAGSANSSSPGTTGKRAPIYADTASRSKKPSRSFRIPWLVSTMTRTTPRRRIGFSWSDTSFSNRLLLVVHAEKGDSIRIISARRVTQHEREDYEHDA